jgi:mono/diheme cytochrome c family protein
MKINHDRSEIGSVADRSQAVFNLVRPVTLFIFIGLFAFSACSSSESPTEEEAADSSEHHMDNMGHIHTDPPDEFAELTNPLANDPEAIEGGMVLYDTLCVSCHGPEGRGDGPAGEVLEPKPANLADSMMMGELSDGYLFWRISKGGAMEPFNSAMPAWEASLTEAERWQLVSYIRSLSDAGNDHTEDDHHMDDDHHQE